MSRKKCRPTLPPVHLLKQELEREKQKKSFGWFFRSTVYALLVVAAVCVLASTLFFPVLQIYGGSMSPTLSEGETVVAVKGFDFHTGDVVAFYYNNKILIKRVIAASGDWVDIREDGTVLVNGTELDEPYLTEKAFGECDIELPYQVPEGKYFVMGDHRSISVDSRSTTVGCVAEEQVVGKLVFRLWPLSEFGTLA